MKHIMKALTLLAALATLVPVTVSAQAIATDDMRALEARSIGPAATGGRIHDVEALPSDPSTMFVAAASGGLWKTTNRGQTWTNVFDTMAVSTFGDVDISRSNNDVIYVGTGEQQNRQSTSYGNGVYKSTDGGDSWTHLGLAETRHIGRVRVHPTNPDIAYVAALGNLWAPSEDRGVFKTTDGGRSWDKVLYIDEYTGVVDMVMDMTDPNTIYAATYQRQRTAWGFNGGGPGGGIHKTTDGGATWKELEGGLPEGDKGRIGLAISESNPQVLNALVETASGETQGTYRSENGGLMWERVSDLDIRPMYYSHIWIDPTDEDVVYALATRSSVSRDGGRTWTSIARAPTYDVGVHADHHALWIDPNNTQHIYLAGDAGLNESYDGGENFRRINNFPIAQFYALGVDMRDPYWVYGGLQDNHSFFGPSETRRWAGILNDDWMQSGFGDGMYWQADPRSARFTYGSSNGGTYFRYDAITGDNLDISPRAPLGVSYRFDWTSPMMLSQHNPDVLYVAGNRFFTSPNKGESWTSTEDLSRQIDRDDLEIQGVRGSDITISRNDGTGSWGEAVTLDESPVDPAVLWVGFDDGNLQVSQNGGATWSEVSRNVQGIRDGAYVSRITASFTAPGTAYATFDDHRAGDFSPYVYRTEDFGMSWAPLHGALPDMGVVNVIVEHPDNPNTLFVGTEHHVFASTDAGINWAKVPNLPTTHYDDMVIHPREKDLVMGTHGRGFWILDDTRAIAEWAGATAPVTVLSAPTGTIMVYKKDTSYRGQADFLGKNPVDGVEITYKLAGSGSATLAITHPNGDVIREMGIPGGAGVHRVNWDLRHSTGSESETWAAWDNAELARPIGNRGAWVTPGVYTATVSANGSTSSTHFTVRGDPEMPQITQAMYNARERFMLDAQALTAEIQAYMRENGMGGGGGRGGFGRGGGPPLDTPQGKLTAAMRAVGGAFSSLNGGQVRGGTLYPPTTTHRQQFQLAKSLFDDVRGGMDR
jgi:photosystem II stability/assembly factor-like uncharacterized protein